MSNSIKELSHNSDQIIEFTINEFKIKLAETEKELDELFRLRYEVFNVEMGEGLSSSEATGKDIDEYDKYCGHLIVVDTENNNKIVGTYRLLDKTSAKNGIGFYSETEFDISRLKELDEDFIEIGRSCVHKDYRSKNIMKYLWAGLAKILELTKAKFLFGCGSIHSENIDDISKVFRYFKEKHYAEEKHRCSPKKENVLEGLNPEINIDNAKQVFKLIPPILKGYIRLSAVCCGEPAWDHEFGCADLLLMLDTNKITKKYANHFFRNQ